jgi:hypothetical protein
MGPLIDGFEAEATRARAKATICKAEDAAFWRARGMTLQLLGQEGSLDAAAFAPPAPPRLPIWLS